MLNPNYKKTYDEKEFEDEAEDDEKYIQMDEDPSKRLRMSAIQALKHPFITDIAVRLIDELNDTSTKEGRYLN